MLSDFNADGAPAVVGDEFECNAGLWVTCCPPDKWNDSEDSLLVGLVLRH